ncbi:MAG: glycosyltransferase [Burkholderiales bacterium]
MNVVHVIVGLNVGGAERMLQRLVAAHGASHGGVHTVVSLTSPGVIGPELSAAGVEVIPLGIRSPFDVPGALLRLYRLLRQRRPEVVQTWMYHADLLGGSVARLAGVPRVIWGVRTTEIVKDSAGSARWVRQICAVMSRWVPHAIVCAANASARNHRALGYAGGRMVVIANGFDVTTRTPLDDEAIGAFRDSQGLGREDLVVGFVGRFNGAKDVPNFVAAAQRVVRAVPGARFLMVGRGIDARNEFLADLIRDAGLASHMVLLGERSDIAQCLGAMDVFCLSSRTEGFPNVVGEAMVMGVPCVVTDVGDAALIVGETGIVVPRQDAEALAAGIESLAHLTRGQRRALGLRARQRIVAEFSMDRAVQKFDDVYWDKSRTTTGNP